MKLEIKPEPSRAERTAIEQALAGVPAKAARLRSAWREAGVRESTKDQAAARPRKRPGATRA